VHGFSSDCLKNKHLDHFFQVLKQVLHLRRLCVYLWMRSGRRERMERNPLGSRILAEFDGFSPQIKVAARYLVEHPDDVALLTMREQARRAGVQPATMTRLAQGLGFSGYEEIRELYAAAIRAGSLGFSGGAGRQVAAQKQKGERAVAAEMAAALGAALARLDLDALVAAAGCLARARRIFCLGLRASFPLAWTVGYLLGLLDDRAVLLDDAAGLSADRTRGAGDADALLVFGFSPYSRATVETARRLHGQGLAVVAVTDSPLSPLARIARHAVPVAVDAPAFFRPMTPALAAAEILAALVAGARGEAALADLARTEAHLSESRVHWVDSE
jgi:DNA-binding MurR/RpiR family transcriptional regulator